MIAALIALIGTIVGALIRDLSRRIDRVGDRMDRLNRAVELAARIDLLRLMGSPNVSDAVKRQIEPLLREIDGAELTRNGRSG